MPTVLLVDASLSMAKPVASSEAGGATEEYQLKHMATHGLITLVDYFSVVSRLEFCTLVIYSSLYDVLIPFTRDYSELKEALLKMDSYDKTCLETALQGVKLLVAEEWGTENFCQIVIVTDGGLGIGKGSLRKMVHNHNKGQQKNPVLPFPFPCKLHIMLLAEQADLDPVSLKHYEKLIEMNHHRGSISMLEDGLTNKSVQQMFLKLAEENYTPFYGVLHCGNIHSDVQLLPSPEAFTRFTDFEVVTRTVSEELQVCGFLEISDISCPPVISRHLVSPRFTRANLEKSEDEEVDLGKIPSFCVLLHGSLKIENMVALVQLSSDWYGIVYSWADNKKRSNLILSVFEPGVDVLPWMGKLKKLGPCQDFPVNPYGEDDNVTPFPVKPPTKRSYTQSSTVSWIKTSSLQSDIQKILRHARKLPDKQSVFYKELNRLRKAALSLGFQELIESVATLLERECTMLPGTAHPDAALQLTHATKEMRMALSRNLSRSIHPLQTNFTEDNND